MQDNACKILVCAEEKDSFYHLRIIDEGMGLDVEAYKDKLFKPYQRLNMDRPGRGLGLYLVKYQLDQLDSEILLIPRDKGLEVDVRIKKQASPQNLET